MYIYCCFFNQHANTTSNRFMDNSTTLPFILSPSLESVLPPTNGTVKACVIITRDEEGLHIHDDVENPVQILQTKLDQEKLDNTQLQSKLKEAKDTILRKNQEISSLQEQCERLSAQVGPDDATKKTLAWLQKALYKLDTNGVVTETSTQVKNLASLPDEEFESLTKTIDHVACMRYAIRKKQTRKEGQELFKAIKARDPVGSEINSFSREIRIGEFLVNLTYAYNKECSAMEMSSILRNNTIWSRS